MSIKGESLNADGLPLHRVRCPQCTRGTTRRARAEGPRYGMCARCLVPLVRLSAQQARRDKKARADLRELDGR